jgi:Restriction endonuclease
MTPAEFKRKWARYSGKRFLPTKSTSMILIAMGYVGSRKEAAAVTQKVGDEGIDGVINEVRLGLDVIYIQAERWKQSVREKLPYTVGKIILL